MPSLTARRLQRHGIAVPTAADPADAVRHMGAMQAQDYAASLWAIGRIRRRRCRDAVPLQASGRQGRHHAYFSLRQLIEPRVSVVLDSISTSKPLRSRYFSVTAEPDPTMETP